ncbi:hypothetical protein LOK49_LG02G00955 [Camellia lanceoleosa]|uniref:Uncharacterized protein n=1 Tax=Camellia lanceoleosa TaxID=1840588 RepID=A0ACC0INL4_9ERIC|nr:hypothetical protein LOK49_LG02G00955 [Camellia lanceoleosa]
MLKAETFAPDGGNQKDLQMVVGKKAEAPVGFALQNSFVKKIKENVRRERKLPEFEYPMLRGRLRRVDGSEVDEHDKKRSGYGLNNRFAVWKLVKDDVKCKISTAYERDGDEVCCCCLKLWACHGTQDMVVNMSDTSRDRYLEANFRACVGCRYLHFPICHKGHWKLVVYDTEDGSWKHYNPLMSRTDSEDRHYNVASILKRNVLDYIRRTCLAAGDNAIVCTEDRNMVLEAVINCPQQRADVPDCAIIVCYIMRQYVHNVGIHKAMEDTTCISACATMVEAFVNDPQKGLEVMGGK